MARGQKIKYENNHKIINNVLLKLCNRHNEFFPTENAWLPCTTEYFYINSKNTTDGLHPTCIECEKKKSMIWKRNNKRKVAKSCKKTNQRPDRIEDIRRRMKEYRDSGRQLAWSQTESGKESVRKGNRKHAEKKHIIYDSEWVACKEYFGNCCAYCGLPIEKHFTKYKNNYKLTDFHKEHVIHEGKNDLSNCIPSCESCNTSKHEKTLNQWYNKNNPNYTYERYYKIYIWYRYDYRKYIMPKRRFKGQRMIDRIKEVEIKTKSTYNLYLVLKG